MTTTQTQIKKSTTVSFTRLFTRGALKGLSHNDRISFLTPSLAHAWVQGVRENSASGRLEYVLSRVEFSA